MKIKTNSRHLNAVYRYVYTKKNGFCTDSRSCICKVGDAGHFPVKLPAS